MHDNCCCRCCYSVSELAVILFMYLSLPLLFSKVALNINLNSIKQVWGHSMEMSMALVTASSLRLEVSAPDFDRKALGFRVVRVIRLL